MAKKAEEDDASNNDSGNNGLIFRPSCSDNCITTQNKKCGHGNMATEFLNKIGDFVAFPALWIHHGYYKIQSKGTVVFQAQLFAVPSSDIFASKRTIRSNIAVKSHTKRNFCNIRKETLESKEDNDLASGHEVQDDRDHCCLCWCCYCLTKPRCQSAPCLVNL